MCRFHPILTLMDHLPLQAILFDWGDTVMRVFPGYHGPMADWPEVAAMPGVAQALAELAPHYRLALATNAQDSDAALVRVALSRAGLESYFAAVVTSKELAAAKPDPGFFKAALAQVRCAPGEAAMVGDSYAADVQGAKAAGLRAVWFNPTAAHCPEPQPAYDGEVKDMADLPRLLENPWLPDVPECLGWLADQGASPGMIRHMRLVAAIAFRLAERLRAAGERVDPLLAHRGGLLHDLAKAGSADRVGQRHDLVAGDLLRARGYSELARIAERHAVWALTDERLRPTTWEEKVVCYGDRLAHGDQIADVETRLSDVAGRRPELAADFERFRSAALTLQSDIANRLRLTPAEMVDWLRANTDAGLPGEAGLRI